MMLSDALGVRQAVAVLHVKHCRVLLHGSEAESAAEQDRESGERDVPGAGQAGRGLAAWMEVQWLLHSFTCLTVISGARL